MNNAGITRDRLVLQMSPDDWDATWQTNLAGVREATRAALARMKQRRAGRIVNVSSVVGVTGNAGQANYAAAKSALQGLTRQTALEAAPFGITVNCVIPGYFPTDATSHLSGASSGMDREDSDGARRRRGRCGGHDCFPGNRGSRYITGQCVAVDGGLLAAAGGYLYP